MVAPDEKARIARFLAKHAVSVREEVERDVAPYRGMSPAHAWRDVEAVCRATFALLATSPDRAAILAERDPPHRTFETIMRTLRARARSAS